MPVTTIQATGKIWKLLQVIAVLLFCAAVVSCQADGGGITALFFLLGVSFWLLGRAGAWWYHG